MVGPGVDLLRGEPQGDLGLGALDGVRAVADVAAHVDAHVAADGSGGRVGGVGGAEHHAAGLDGVEALPHHAAHGTHHHVVDEAAEELLVGEVSVVLLQVLAAWGHELHGLELEALVLETADDVADEPALDAVRLDHDVGALGVARHCEVVVGVEGGGEESGKGERSEGREGLKETFPRPELLLSLGLTHGGWTTSMPS